MKRIKTILFLLVATSSFSQNSINVGPTYYNLEDFSFIGIEASYERFLGKNQHVGLEAGFEYEFSESLFGVTGDINFYFNKPQKGFLMGLGSSFGGGNGLAYIRIGGEIGYAIPIKKARLIINSGVGIIGLGTSGGYGGGLEIPFKLTYSFLF